jgi:hypothetical protein
VLSFGGCKWELSCTHDVALQRCPTSVITALAQVGRPRELEAHHKERSGRALRCLYKTLPRGTSHQREGGRREDFLAECLSRLTAS